MWQARQPFPKRTRRNATNGTLPSVSASAARSTVLMISPGRRCDLSRTDQPTFSHGRRKEGAQLVEGKERVTRQGTTLSEVEPSFEVNLFGLVYMLCAIVYYRPQSEDRGAHFVSQVYRYSQHEKCWFTCDPLSTRGSANCGPPFDASFFHGQEYIVLCVDSDVVEEHGCLHAMYSLDDDNSSSDGHLHRPPQDMSYERKGKR